MVRTIGAFYTDLNYKSAQGRLVLFQPISFFFRRLHIAWLVVSGSLLPLWYQISQTMAITGIVTLTPYWLLSYRSLS